MEPKSLVATGLQPDVLWGLMPLAGEVDATCM